MLKLTLASLILVAPVLGQIADYPDDKVAGIPVNYTEAKAGSPKLPEALILPNGKAVLHPKTWVEKRRPQIVKLFEENQYGKAPGRPAEMTFEVLEKEGSAFDGKAIRRQIAIYLTKDKSGPKIDLLMYLPAGVTTPVPVLLNIAFSANSLTVDDPEVKVGEIWGRDKKKVSAAGGRGIGKLNPMKFVSEGIGLATFYYGDVEPDFIGGTGLGIRAKYLKPGQSEPAPGEWGAIAAWAWGMSRAMDYLETDKNVDAKKVAITGISRLGKTVMWAGAADTRFAAVIASCSGEGGAAISRRNYGETIAHLVEPTRYPYQFAGNYAKWAAHPEESPVDANLLVALIAPRPLLLQTGNTDKWSDPKGEFLAAVAAEPVYRLFGKQGLGITEVPPAGEPVLHTMGYLMHAGGHAMVPADWDVFVRFLKMHF